VSSASTPPYGEWSKDSDDAELPPPTPKAPRKPFADVLAAFMEQSNVRWGEIIGGLLIIGCSTALVISLWAQISRVPVIKFMIFTTVTAALFGIGFYTAHHWKLPTTSRGILTIATLLVPLNFLAIAAVSANSTQGVLVIGSEIIAPVLFLCLVYFAGRTITTKWPHLLAAGALGSSVGQLLIRHFATPDISPAWLIVIAAFPVLCYVGATSWMLKLALADGEIDETEARTHPQNELFAEARQMRHQQRCARTELDREVAIRYSVERVLGEAVEAEFACDSRPVDRKRCSRERRRAERQAVYASAAVREAFRVPGKHLEVREQMMRERDRLRDLEMREAGHDRFGVLPGEIEQRPLQTADERSDIVDRGADVQANVRRDLVVARARGVQPLSGIADEIRQSALDIEMHVFEIDRPLEGAAFDFLPDLSQSSLD